MLVQHYVEIQFIDLELTNYWNRKYSATILGAVRFVYVGPDRMTPAGTGPYVHAPMTPEQFDRAKELLSGIA